ncbi:MAG: hypothetical protein AAGF12_37665 [Myxococcota bacterium]
MSVFAALLIAAAVGFVPRVAVAQVGGDTSVDASLRYPTLGPGDWLLGRGTEVLPHLESGFGLDLDHLHEPLVIVDGSADGSPIVDRRTTATILYGAGLFGIFQGTVAVPVVFQSGNGPGLFTGDSDQELEPAVLGALRLDFTATLPRPVLRGHGAALRLALASGILFPTGDEAGFAGGGSFSGYVSAVGRADFATVFGVFELGLEGQGRFRDTDRLLDRAFGTELVLTPGAAFHFLERRVSVAAEVMSVIGLVSDSDPVVLGMLELRGRFLRNGAAELTVGGGLGFNDASRSPNYQLVFSFRYIPRGP